MTTDKPDLTKATPRPWYHERTNKVSSVIVGPDDIMTAYIGTHRGSEVDISNAALIVEAVNAYDRHLALIAALTEALRQWYPHVGCPVCSGDCASANPPVIACPMLMARDALAEARAALKLAKESGNG